MFCTYNIQGVGFARAACYDVALAVVTTSWSPPLPSAADHDVAQQEPSVPHVSMDSVVVTDLSWHSERIMSNPSPSNPGGGGGAHIKTRPGCLLVVPNKKFGPSGSRSGKQASKQAGRNTR